MTPPLTCPLCGYSFERLDQETVCRRCPLALRCNLLCCPRCRYEWAGESSLVNWFKRNWSKRKNALTHSF
ncbi:MAG: hypothetical protein HYS41_03730 [Candidatus Omnitrophica bacterium]|nr:hypothetical protein [Candidatus Omnitrophota bacterium]